METALRTTETGLQIAEVQRIIGEAPATLQDNRTSAERAVAFAANLIKNSQDAGMSDVLDTQMASFIEKGKKTLVVMNDRRKPFTQMMDALKKEFTGLESSVKAKADEVQSIRNTYAAQKMEAQRERERQVQLKLDSEREAIELKARATTLLAGAFQENLMETKQLLIDKFNTATLENLDDVCSEIGLGNYELTVDIYRTFRPVLQSRYISPEELKDTVSRVMNTNFRDDVGKHFAGILATKRELLDKKESKRAELEALAKAGAEERERLEAERQQREAAEKERLEREAAAAKAKAEAAAAVQASGAMAAAMVDASAATAAKTPQVKEGYEIILKNVAANLLIAQMWFENEGKTLSQDKINKVTFDRMRRFCETHAMKTGELISSPMVEYIPVYKAK